MDYNSNSGDGEGHKVVFTPPQGFTPPETKGDTFDLVCTFRKEPGGKLCLTHLGDTEMEGYDHDEKNESQHAPDYSEVSKGIMHDMEALGDKSQSVHSY